MCQCINCGFFLNCEQAESNKTKCDKYIKAQRIINK